MTFPAIGVVWRAKVTARFAVSVPPSFSFTAIPTVVHDEGALGLSLPPSFTFDNTAIAAAQCVLSVPPQFHYIPPNKGLGTVNLTVPPSFSFEAEVRYPSTFALSTPPSLSFTVEEVRTGFPYAFPFTTIGGGEVTATEVNTRSASVNALGAGTQLPPAAVSVTSDTVLALTGAVYVYTGTGAAAWTLPAASGMGTQIHVLNRGTATVTVTRTGTDQIRSKAETLLSKAVPAGSSAEFVADGTYWLTGG